MNRLGLVVFGLAALGVCCSSRGLRPPPRPGPIELEPGGVAGYQHGLEKSRFITGGVEKSVTEFGLVRWVGREGTFAMDLANGAVVAVANARSPGMQKEVWFSKSADQHNQRVLGYFVGAGIPRAQIAGVEATTSLDASGGPGRGAFAGPVGFTGAPPGARGRRR